MRRWTPRRLSLQTASSTPESQADAGLPGALFTLDEIASGFTGDPEIKIVEPDEIGAQDDPDPRGPCGAVIDQPQLADGDSILFQVDRGPVLMHVTWQSDQAAKWAQAMLKDLTPGCDPWQSDTPFGGPQTVTPQEAWTFDGIGDVAFGTVQSIVGPNNPAGASLNVSNVVVVIGDAVSVLTAFGMDLQEDFMRNTAFAMVEKLRLALESGSH